jgi:hypothetical protein
VTLAATAGFAEDGQAAGQDARSLSLSAAPALSFSAQLAAVAAETLSATPGMQEAAQLSASAAMLLSSVAALVAAATGGGVSTGPFVVDLSISDDALSAAEIEVTDDALYAVSIEVT